ncbi:MAG: hypothetical protein IPJ71_18025 [Bdellovibrionales bacterium]|nr:hypothetical protein [Bdellovibrionales bacterium]
MKPIISEETSQLLIFLFLCAVGTFLFHLTKDFATLYIYQERDLERSFQLLNKHLIWHGPELTGGGFLPGSLYYLILSSFLAINRDLISCWYGMLAMGSVGGAVVWLFLHRRFGSTVGILWILNYFGSPFNFIVLSYFWNPSFSILFILVALCAIIETFAFSGSLWSLVFAFSLSVLSAQLHLTGLILVGLLLFLHLSTRRFGLKEISNRNFTTALFLSLFWFLPYVVFRLSDLKDRYHATTSESAGTSWISFQVNEIIESWTSYLNFHGVISIFFEAGLNMWIFIPFSLLLLISLKWIYRNQIQLVNIQRTQTRVNVILLVTLALSVIVAAPIFLSIGLFSKFRYGIIFMLTLQMASSIWVGSFLKSHFSANRMQLLKWGIPIFFFLFLTGILTYLYVPKYVEKRRFYAPSFFNLRAALQYVHDQTCWTPEQMREKIFSVNIYSFISKQLLSERGLPCQNSELNFKSAIFLMPRKKPSESTLGKLDMIKELKESKLENVFLQNIENGDLELRNPVNFGSLQVILVSERVPNSSPIRFHNTGYPYSRSPLENQLKNAFSLVDPIVLVEPNVLLAKTSPCSGQTGPDVSYCHAGFLLKLSPSLENSEVLTVSILGEALSQPSFWIDPQRTSAWISPFVEFRCGEQITKVLLAEAIGFNRRQGWKLLNSSVLAPFSKAIAVPCPSSLTEIRVGSKLGFLRLHGESRDGRDFNSSFQSKMPSPSSHSIQEDHPYENFTYGPFQFDSSRCDFNRHPWA